MRRRAVMSFLIGYFAIFGLLLAAPAGAEIEGPCTAAFNGVSFNDLDTPAKARENLVIQPGESVRLTASVPATDLVSIDVLFPPLTITLADFKADEPSEQGSEMYQVDGDLPLGDLASYGAGIFQFVGRTDDCRGNAFFVIGGVEPWETVVGKTAIGVAGVGILIGLTSWAPALIAGGGGIIRSVIAGGPIGIGAAVLVQQAGLIPLSATSAGVAVVGSSVVAILVTKGLAGIHGVMSTGAAAGGGALPQPPPISPPPTPAGSPPPPETTFVDDATLLGGEPTPVADATLAPPPQTTFIDDATLLGGEPTPVADATLAPPPPIEGVPDATLAPPPPVEGVPNAPTTPGPGGTPLPPQPTPAAPAPPSPSPSAPGSTAQPPPPAATPAGTTPPPPPPSPSAAPAPSSPTPPAPAAPTPSAPAAPTPSAPAAPTPPAPTAPSAPSPAAQPATPTPPSAASPPTPGASPTAPTAPTPSAPPPPAPHAPPGSSAGSGMGLAGAAAVGAGVLGAASRAAAAQKRAMAGTEAADPHWFYVATPTDVYGLDDYNTVIGRLQPGTWYSAKATYDEWVHAVDPETGTEGWVAKDATTRHQP